MAVTPRLLNARYFQVGQRYRGQPAKGFDNEPYYKAEAEAREAKLNMWSLGDKYISPREWGRMHR